MEIFPTPAKNTRLGFYYFPDALHYRESDLVAWLPELRALGASWIVLKAPLNRAIPEPFLQGILSAGLEPILHFHLPLESPAQPEVMHVLFETYARWGVHYVALFDRPNRRRSWPAKDWAQSELVERFIDIYLPLAEAISSANLFPVFPPLEPGGDYWDTAFLRSALDALQRRSTDDLLRKLVIGAYAWADNRSLNWGAGGPERWAGARPYRTPPGEQDQRGFHIFDWYQTIAQAVLGRPCPILILGTGCHIGDQIDQALNPIDRTFHTQRNLVISRLLLGETVVNGDESAFEPIPPEVLAGNFWVLAANRGSPFENQAWYKPDGDSLPIVGVLRQWIADRSESPGEKSNNNGTGVPTPEHPIRHYLLLPEYEWGVADWHLDVIRPFVKKHRPTIGYSHKEAILAGRVTIVGGNQSFPEDLLDKLRTAGCQVERIAGDGTSIATQLRTQ